MRGDSGSPVMEPSSKSPEAGSSQQITGTDQTPANHRSQQPRQANHSSSINTASGSGTKIPDSPASAGGAIPGTGRAVGIQLAENVRLPAAVMDLAQPISKQANPLSPAARAAKEEITGSFYQNLANLTLGSAPGMSSADPATGSADAPDPVNHAPDDIGTETVVAGPGPEVETALEQANATYRALFGDDAYNHSVIQSTIEVHLPVDPGTD